MTIRRNKGTNQHPEWKREKETTKYELPLLLPYYCLSKTF